MLVAVLGLAYSLFFTVDGDDLIVFLVGLALFIIVLYMVSISMIFTSMDSNIEKMTNQFLYVQKLQERELEVLNKISNQCERGEKP